MSTPVKKAAGEESEEKLSAMESIRDRVTNNVACSSKEGNVQTIEEEEEPIELPNRDELRDMLEWDMGVAETLFRFKQWQIAEQVDIDKRSGRVKKKQMASTIASKIASKIASNIASKIAPKIEF